MKISQGPFAVPSLLRAKHRVQVLPFDVTLRSGARALTKAQAKVGQQQEKASLG